MSADVADSAVKDEIDSTTQEAKINGSSEPTNGETLEEKIDMDHSEQKPSTSAQAELEVIPYGQDLVLRSTSDSHGGRLSKVLEIVRFAGCSIGQVHRVPHRCERHSSRAGLR